MRIAEQLAKAPDQSFPKTARSEAALEATYRFFGNDSVTPAAILQPHVAATAARCAQAGAVFVAHDSSELRFSSERDGVGRVSGDETHGFIGHFALAVGAKDRAPLGILGMEPVCRERGTRVSYRRSRTLEEKESRRWLTLVERVDSELPNRARKHPYRRTRAATFAVTAASVTIRRPRHGRSHTPAALRLNVVRVHEKNVGCGIEPVEWRLVTTEPIDTVEDVAAIVDGYRARWVIEEYFRALKQGCAYERRQLESKHALLNALAVFAPIAWQMLALRQLSRDRADLPADAILSPMKLTLLQRRPDVRLRPDLTIRDAMLAIAALGGHIRNNGDPGWQVLGRGYEDLLLLERGAVLALGCDQS